MWVLGLDGSTAITGVALVEFDRGGPKLVGLLTEFDASKVDIVGDALTKRIARIGWTCEQLRRVMDEEGVSLLNYHVAYEYNTERGRAATEALCQASGAYLPILHRGILPVHCIEPSTAKAVWNGVGLKTEDAKDGAVAWANREFGKLGIQLDKKQDAMADALAVCVAAWSRVRAQSLAQSQQTMFGKRVGRK